MPCQDLRILVVDSTIVYCQILSEIVETIPRTVLVDTSTNGVQALSIMEAKPVDLVLLDVEILESDGLGTLKSIQQRFPEMGLIVIRNANSNAVDVTMKALEKGAMDFISKPEGNDRAVCQKLLSDQLRPLILSFQTRRNLSLLKKTPQSASQPPRKRKITPPSPHASALPRQIDLLAIGISTGGPSSLIDVIPRLPGALGIPVLIVQHMPPVFTASLANTLNERSALTILEAQERDPVIPNTVYIAPGGKHMVVRKTVNVFTGLPCPAIALNENPPENHCRPSVDVLFRSIAAHYRGNVLSLIMTGMGNDGCEGVRALKYQGAYSLTQSKETCAVYGMPMAVDRAGLSDQSVPLDSIADTVAEIVNSVRRHT